MKASCCCWRSGQWIWISGQEIQKQFQNPNKDKIKQFYYRSDIVYTVPGKGDEMTVWNEEGKQKLQKYYLAMCKCQIHKNLFLKLDAMGCDYKSSWWETVFVTHSPTVHASTTHVLNVKREKNSYQERGWMWWQQKSNGMLLKFQTNQSQTQMMTKHTRRLQSSLKKWESFSKVKEHQSVKRIQASEFQKDLLDKTVRLLQIDYAMAYQCELQKETMGALWRRGSVNLFTCAIYHKSETKTMMFCTNYKGKDKFSTGLFLNMLYDYIPSNEHISTKVIWPYEPSSEFKNQYMHFLIQESSKKHGKPFIWKFSATSHGKAVVNAVGGKIKSSFHKKVMSLGKDWPIVQDSESFAKLANELLESTTIIHVTKEEVSAYKDSNPFGKSVPIHGISNMHVMKSDGTSLYLWSNSSYHKAGTNANI